MISLFAYEVFAFSGSSRSKISAPPGFSAPARVPPPGFPSQDGLNPNPGFSSGIVSQEVYKTPPRLPSPFSSGLSSQDGPNPPSRTFSAFSSGLSLQDGSNHPSRFPSAFTSGFSSRDGSNQVYGSMYPGLFTFSIFLFVFSLSKFDFSYLFAVLDRNSSPG